MHLHVLAGHWTSGKVYSTIRARRRCIVNVVYVSLHAKLRRNRGDARTRVRRVFNERRERGGGVSESVREAAGPARERAAQAHMLAHSWQHQGGRESEGTEGKRGKGKRGL